MALDIGREFVAFASAMRLLHDTEELLFLDLFQRFQLRHSRGPHAMCTALELYIIVSGSQRSTPVDEWIRDYHQNLVDQLRSE